MGSKMRHWIVCHNPHPIPDTHAWHIFYKERPATRPSDGDRVLFYETQARFAGRKHFGRKGIVSEAHVSGKIKEMRPIGDWKFELACVGHQQIFIPLEQIRLFISQPFYRRNLTAISATEYRQLIELVR